MTPVIIPVHPASEWHINGTTHNELRYLLRSIHRHVEDPFVVLIGHLPEWVNLGAGSIVYLPHRDDRNNADHNIADKIYKACLYLAEKKNYTGGFLRPSDDQLLLKPYKKPIIWESGELTDYFLSQMGGTNVAALRAFKKWFVAKFSPLFFDVHLPQWMPSVTHYIEFYEHYTDRFRDSEATINTAYFNVYYRDYKKGELIQPNTVDIKWCGLMRNPPIEKHMARFYADFDRWLMMNYNDTHLAVADTVPDKHMGESFNYFPKVVKNTFATKSWWEV